MIPTSAEAELALINASNKDIIDYVPGSSKYTLLQPEKLSDKQHKALQYIQDNVLTVYGSTGVQQCIEAAIQLLDLIVVEVSELFDSWDYQLQLLDQL